MSHARSAKILPQALLALMLVLSGRLLIECVGRLEDGTGGGHVQLNGCRGGEPRIEAVKEIEHVALCVERLDLRGVQETPAGQSVERDKITDAWQAGAKRERDRRRGERSVPQRQGTGWPAFPQP